MGTPLGPKYMPHTYMDPFGIGCRDPRSLERVDKGLGFRV